VALLVFGAPEKGSFGSRYPRTTDTIVTEIGPLNSP